ncbi:gluconokinase [Limnohabitans sp. 63ED37-2]|uniref:gluconokinase n=1 Tax=Limnohabitans sp. 63ED37-2 TaxID=1678128 RepID=UPI0007061AA4|nr:gluconokinase [Limnohabitans sp. 63ED37-2]ALK88161.1 Thermoresistant gluconokinase [Limnohabitans sp. 63ED37-2]
MNTMPLRLIVMGVSGCGKSTMASALGERLGLDMVDGDDLHLPESVAKMRSGIALQDADRWPWLDRIGHYLAQAQEPGRVVACSALKRVYRDRIREQAGDVCFVFLDGDFDLIEQRMRQRVGHYMQPGLLDSQFRTLEKPQADESDVIRLPITEPVQDMVAQALNALHNRLHPAL